MKLEDVTALAKAGFTAQQIAALMQLDAAPQQNPSQQTQQPASAAPAQGVVNIPLAPAAAAATMPLTQINTVSRPDISNPTSVAAYQAATGQSATTPKKTFDDVYNAIANMQQQIQASNLLAAQQAQPAQPDADQIIANIINPPTMHKEA